MKKIFEKAMYMLLGAIFLITGVWTGSSISGKNTYHAGSEEQVLIEKARAIDSIVKADTIQNKFIVSRKANELSNIDMDKLNKAMEKGVSIIIVPENDVFSSPILNDKTQTEKNKANGVVTDCAYVPDTNQIIVSLNAPSGVLVDQLNNALAYK